MSDIEEHFRQQLQALCKTHDVRMVEFEVSISNRFNGPVVINVLMHGYRRGDIWGGLRPTPGDIYRMANDGLEPPDYMKD